MAASSKHDAVRGRYHGCCGYCGVSEEDAGGEFTIDHFIPVVDGGDDRDDNLVYCCFRCNLYKSAFSPTAHDHAAGRVVLHPLRDDPAQHLRLDASSGLLEGLTDTGRFHVTLLHLNRPALVAHRLRRRRAELHQAKHQLLEAENAELRAIIAAQQKYISRLRELLGDEPSQR
jgi:hypothetical protein